ncbi:MAG: 5-formyltetrahydrofolate cyclo-ligase [Clostridia bacterium]|nr:5-formyltetrahydrofolate cyclo-ligase [Clostridia bacterium]
MSERLTKNELRRSRQKARAELGKKRKKEWDTAILRRILDSPYFKRAKTILLYAPTVGEVNVLPLMRAARDHGKAVAFPKCHPETNTIEFFLLAPDAKLEPGAFGIYEPPAGSGLCKIDETSFCLVPGLAYDKKGNRVGYGKGYYDRFLADFPGVSCGVLYEEFLADEIPTEEWDRPVNLLVTDRRTIGVSLPVEEKAEHGKGLAFFKDLWAKIWAKMQKEATEPLGERNFRPVHSPPVLVFVSFFFLSLVKILDTFVFNRTWEMVLMIPFQILSFGVPLGIYYLLGGKSIFKRLRLYKIRKTNIWFLFCVLGAMITGSLLFSILTGGISSLDGKFTLYSTFVANMSGNFWSLLFVTLAFAAIPAVCEEIFYRGVLCPFYERFGSGCAIFISALFFALTHFTLPLFPTYLFLGLVLSFTLYATGSLYATIALHFLYNLFCLFGQPYLSDFYVNAGNNAVFIFLVTVLFLLFCAFGVGEARKIYHRYAKEGKKAVYEKSLLLREYPRAILKLLFTPGTLFCLILWLVMSIINL